MNLASINEGKYPEKPLFTGKREKAVFGIMICYSLITYFQIAVYYVWGL